MTPYPQGEGPEGLYQRGEKGSKSLGIWNRHLTGKVSNLLPEKTGAASITRWEAGSLRKEERRLHEKLRWSGEKVAF